MPAPCWIRTAVTKGDLSRNITVEAAGPTGTTVTYTVTVSDDVDPSPTWSCTPASGATFPVADTTVTCNATDDRGNSQTATFHVVVQDQTAPVLTLPSVLPKEATDELTSVNWGAGLAATDLVDGVCAWNPSYATYCSGSGTVTGTCVVSCDDASGSLYPVGTRTVHCCAKDTHQNKSTGQFNVTVQDTTGPVVTPPSAPAPVAQSGACTTVIFNDTATADDLVDGIWTFTCTPASGSCFPVASTYIDCSTDDSHGNSSGPAGFNVVVY